MDDEAKMLRCSGQKFQGTKRQRPKKFLDTAKGIPLRKRLIIVFRLVMRGGYCEYCEADGAVDEQIRRVSDCVPPPAPIKKEHSSSVLFLFNVEWGSKPEREQAVKKTIDNRF